jgi:protein ImuA
MITPHVHPAPEELHPALWRASQLARFSANSVDTGHVALSNQLPDSGWPTGSLIELLVQQPGVGELKLLAPALRKVSNKKLVLLQPPHVPNALAFASLGLPPSDLVWLTSQTTADALWAAETVLRSGMCGSLLFWNTHVRQESFRRLHLAAQAGETLFFVLRPLAAAQDASPSPSRLSLRPAESGVDIGFVKRRGPQRDEPLFLPLQNFIGKNDKPAITQVKPTKSAGVSEQFVQ